MNNQFVDAGYLNELTSLISFDSNVSKSFATCKNSIF